MKKDSLKKLELEATQEIVIQTFINDDVRRNDALLNFIEILDKIDGSVMISLDAEWGAGKTFFVKQIELLLNYYRHCSFGEETISDLDTAVNQKQRFRSLEMKNTFIPIYFDAWMHDDHENPMISLLYSIIEQGYVKEKFVNQRSLRKGFADVLSGLTIGNVNIDLDKMIDSPNDFFSAVKSTESIKKSLENVFDEIITEHCQKLLVIVDELDRCRPDYAVRILEKTKHLINDQRVMFLFSINKTQLIHTIKKFYGDSFNASAYLNRFFDFEFNLERIDTDLYLDYLDAQRQGHLYSQKLISEMCTYYRMTMREFNIYYQKMQYIEGKIGQDGFSEISFITRLFASIIWALKIRNDEKAQKFINGDLQEELINIFKKVHIYNVYVCRYIAKEDYDELEALCALYDFMFSSSASDSFKTNTIEIDAYHRKEFFRILWI
ncbi:MULTISPECIES: P-loop NTPase fold protein [unclassified Lactonifactor]|uniref:KAP family P-loop NTPase fold protein n=1 Tax=unclassified Lactonifactor TaxID=2636670 RepID=UPI001567890A|nr:MULTISPECIES: P-loop NTPase fold protein [unclassified Lactonifactor]